jgi:arylsulfatase A-like enzyme
MRPYTLTAWPRSLLPGVICALILIALALSIAGCGREGRPNVLIITIDTLRADHLSCYGYAKPTSPRIDAFAHDNALFEHACCQSSQTLPSHTSIMVGTNPRTHKVISHESYLDEDITTLAEILKRRGYRTGAFISSHALDSKYHLDQGFDTYWEVHKEFSIQERQIQKIQEKCATTDAALAWLDGAAGSDFLLWIHWFDPHRPYDPPARYLSQFAGDYNGLVSSDAEFIMNAWRQRIDLTPEDVNYLIGRYDGEIAFTDVQVGRILDDLDARGLLDNTIVVITADHGEILYEHEYYFGHDIGLYDECIMIPLIMHVPGLDASGMRISALVQSLDIMPTVLEVLGLDRPGYLEGKSLIPLMQGSDQSTVAYAFSETFPFPEKCPPRHAVRTAGAKLIWKEAEGDTIDRMYYDLTTDPGEQNNLYAPDLPEAVRLDSVLARWIANGGLHPARIPSAEETGRLRILKSLGYVD